MHVSISCKYYGRFSLERFVPFGTPVRVHDILCSRESTGKVRPSAGYILQGGS
jgi:hypothetical protein